MKKVFIDSGGWYAHLVTDDADHAVAHRLFAQARSERWSLVTTNAVVFETYALVLNRAREGRTLALGLLDDLAAGAASVVRVTKTDETRAVELMRTHVDKA